MGPRRPQISTSWWTCKITLAPPGDATVSIDAVPVEGFVAGALVPIGAGTRVLRAVRPGFAPAERSLAVYAGEVAEVEMVLAPMAPPPPATGRLEVRCAVAGVRVSVGSALDPLSPAPAGTTPLAQPLALPAGSFVLRFERPGAQPRVVPARVVAGKTAVAECGTSPVPPPPPLPPPPATGAGEGTSGPRIAAYAIGGAGLVLGAVAGGLFAYNDGRITDWQSEHPAIDEAYGISHADPSLPRRQSDNDALLDAIHARDAATVAVAVGGGAALLTGVGLLMADVVGGGAAPTDTGTPSAILTPGGAAAGWRWCW